MIITEGIRVHPTSIGRANCIVGYLEAGLPGYAAIADAAHDHSTKIIAQLVHTGRHNDNLVTGSVAWAPSPSRWHVTGRLPHAMTHGDIDELVDHHVKSALMLERAGFDGLEVHFGHGHLLHQFLSLNSNQRTDAYGGSLANRTRLGIEIVTAIANAVKADFAVGIRVSADDFVPGGMDLDATLEMLDLVVQAVPRLDFINVSHAEYTAPSIGYHVADMNYGAAPFAHLPTAVAERFLNVAVLGICRITSLDVAERVLAQSKITLVGMTRAHIADPQIIQKTMEGRVDQIRPCVSCNFCIGELNRGLSLSCMANPTAGREAAWSDVDYGRTAAPRTVLVIGGGPSGLEAARVAAARGHTVHVWEKEKHLGGQLRTGASGAGRADLGLLVDYLGRQVNRLGVTVSTGREADRESIDRLAPDIIIVATGGRAAVEHTFAGPVRDASEVILDPASAGAKAVLLDHEGGWRAASAAETLAAAGCEVSVLSPAAGLFWDINSYSQMLIVERLKNADVAFYTMARVVAWDGTRVTFVDGGRTSRWIDGVDSVCVASPGLATGSSLAELTSGYEIRVIGDALAPRDLLQVMYQGHEAGREL